MHAGVVKFAASNHEYAFHCGDACDIGDVAHAAVIQKMAIEQGLKDPSKAIRKDGKPDYSLNTWAKFGGIKKSALLALRKFQQPVPSEAEERSLADVVLEVSEESEA